MRLIRKCPKDKVYTLHERCPVCGDETKPAHPPRFSPVDRMVKYRILARRGKVC